MSEVERVNNDGHFRARRTLKAGETGEAYSSCARARCRLPLSPGGGSSLGTSSRTVFSRDDGIGQGSTHLRRVTEARHRHDELRGAQPLLVSSPGGRASRSLSTAGCWKRGAPDRRTGFKDPRARRRDDPAPNPKGLGGRPTPGLAERLGVYARRCSDNALTS